MYKIAVEGIYESQTGNGQSKYINFELKFTTSRPNTIGLDTHIQKRYIPYYLTLLKDKGYAVAAYPFHSL